jgi:NTP pyrophosphatase (non-canonical NTP hydrolase)
MIDLKQKELKEWQEKNFPRSRYEVMTKNQLIDMILVMQFTLGMAEEVGEVCHHILKGIQGIRGGVNGFNKDEIADGVTDSLVFGQQLMSLLQIDAEKEIAAVVEKVLKRNWKENPTGNNIPVQEGGF